MKNNIIMPSQSVGYKMDADVMQSVIPDSKISINKIYYKKAFMNIFIQDVNRKFLKNAKYNLVVINHELFFHKGVYNNSEIYDVDYILCKTDIAVKIAKQFKVEYKFKYKIYKIGFTTIFPIIKTTKIYNEMLHSAGSHHWKQTDTIIKLWLKHPELPKITITCEKQCYKNIENLVKNKKLPDNIILYKDLIPIDQYIKLKNKIGIHITPSLTEGFGHYINEARIVGSTILTSNYPPMNELVNSESGILVECNELLVKRNKTKICFINENNLLEGVRQIVGMSTKEKKKLGQNAYNSYIKDKEYFRKRTKMLVDKLYKKNLV
jgi:hypothetical protein